MKITSGGFATFNLALLVSAPAFAQDPDKALIDAVEAKYADVSALKADFVQTTRSQVFGEEKAEGDVVVKRPSMMRWSFGGDSKQFVTDGKTMWIWSQPDNQVIRYDDVSQQASAADSILGSLDQLQETFTVKVVEAAAGEKAFDLRPKEEAQFKHVRLVLTDDLVVSRVVITDAFDNVTELQFKDVKLNVQVPDSTFTFEVPAGAQVIDASQL